MRKLIQYLLPVSFIGLLIFPLINSQLQIWTFPQTEENRTFAEKPTIDLELLDPYPKKYEAYFNDHFSFRTPLLTAFHHFKYQVGHVSAHPEKTILGKEDWCFKAGAEQEIYLGQHEFSHQELEAFSKEWQYRDSVFKGLGVKQLIWTVFPNKQTVYPEFLAEKNKTTAISRRAETVMNSVNSTLPGIGLDPVPAMISAKDSVQVYRKFDNHINFAGAYFVAQQLVEKVRSQFPNVKALDPNQFVWTDTVYEEAYHRNVLGLDFLTETSTFPNYTGVPALSIKEKTFEPPEDFRLVWSYELGFRSVEDTTLPKVLIIRDSFGQYLIPFLKESFGETTLIFDAWQYGRNEEIVAAIKPDIVIYATTESNIQSILQEVEVPQ